MISFEFFPPKTVEGDAALLGHTAPELAGLRPDYCSVTYGAGGSTRDKTLEIAERIQREQGITTMSHLTCVNATREEIQSVLEEARRRGILNILALRGDPPGGGIGFQKTEGGFEYSHELVTHIRKMGGFSIGTAGFPEGHVDCAQGKRVDWDRLKAKVDCGADFVITQLFFDNRDFFEFRDYLRAQGVRVPIQAGIIPILGAAQIRRFTKLCGARLTPELEIRLDALSADDAAVRDFGVEFATAQCRELLAAGVDGLHFYTLNKSYSTTRILQNLGLV